MLATRLGLSLSFLCTLFLRATWYLHSPRVLPIFALAVLISNCVQFPVGYSLHRIVTFVSGFWDAELSSRRINLVATVCKSSVLFGSWPPELPHQVTLVRLVDLEVVPKNPIQTQTQLGYLLPQRFLVPRRIELPVTRKQKYDLRLILRHF